MIPYQFGTNQLTFDTNNELAELIYTGDPAEAKLPFLQSAATELGVALDECACIADGTNDEAMFKATSKGIT